MGLPVSQHLPTGGPPADCGGGWGWDGLTDVVGLPGGRTIALVTAILPLCNDEPREVVPPAKLPNEEALPALRMGADAGEGELDASDELIVTGHCKFGDPLKENCDMMRRPLRAEIFGLRYASIVSRSLRAQ